MPLLIGLKRKGTRSIVPSGTTVLDQVIVLRWPRRALAHLTTLSTPSGMTCALSRLSQRWSWSVGQGLAYASPSIGWMRAHT